MSEIISQISRENKALSILKNDNSILEMVIFKTNESTYFAIYEKIDDVSVKHIQIEIQNMNKFIEILIFVTDIIEAKVVNLKQATLDLLIYVSQENSESISFLPTFLINKNKELVIDRIILTIRGEGKFHDSHYHTYDIYDLNMLNVFLKKCIDLVN